MQRSADDDQVCRADSEGIFVWQGTSSGQTGAALFAAMACWRRKTTTTTTTTAAVNIREKQASELLVQESVNLFHVVFGAARCPPVAGELFCFCGARDLHITTRSNYRQCYGRVLATLTCAEWVWLECLRNVAVWRQCIVLNARKHLIIDVTLKFNHTYAKKIYSL